jgi:cobalt/nickel transport system ATP-binding protein
MTTALRIENLTFTYDGKKNVLEGISLDILKGEKVALIGPNGAGKSTFITMLNGIRTGTGSIEINGNEVLTKNLRKVRSEIGIVFQSPDDQLFCPTVFDDIAFGPLNYGLNKEVINERVSEALENVGLKNYENRVIHELSFGEKKLVSIATVLSMQPSIIAFDEPTSNLDPLHRRKVINWINSKEDLTILLATHDLDMVIDTCDRVIILSGGVVAADGTVEEILTNKELLEANNLELPLSKQ